MIQPNLIFLGWGAEGIGGGGVNGGGGGLFSSVSVKDCSTLQVLLSGTFLKTARTGNAGGGGGVNSGSYLVGYLLHTLNIAFQYLPPDCARIGYTTEGV